MADDRVGDEVRAALAAAEGKSAHPADRSAMLMDIATDLQQRPKTLDHLLLREVAS